MTVVGTFISLLIFNITKVFVGGFLAFAAGAMIYVVIEELIPEAQREEGGSKTDIATIGCMLGFAVMMTLDVALG